MCAFSFGVRWTAPPSGSTAQPAWRAATHLPYTISYQHNLNAVRIVPDVDDKIINRANATGEDPLALSQRFIREFHADMVRRFLDPCGSMQGSTWGPVAEAPCRPCPLPHHQ